MAQQQAPGPPPPHQHVFEVCLTPAEGKIVYVGDGFVRAKGLLPITVMLPIDVDHCGADGCTIETHCAPHDKPLAYNIAQVTGWAATPAGGRFGRLLENGQFDANVPANEVNCFEAPADPGIYELKAQLDDLPETFEGAPLADDDAAWTEPSRITVWEFTIDGAVNAHPTLDALYPFTATIEPTADHLNQSMARCITFELTSSSESGYCINATRLDGPDWRRTGPGDADLKFCGEFGFWVIATDPEHPLNYNSALTLDAVTEATIHAICLDYGTWANVTARVQGIPPGAPGDLYARRAGVPPEDDVYGAPVPIDEHPAPSHIWDGWGQDGDPDDDDDPEPANDPVAPGDGLSRYEEYRGVLLGGQWQTLDPDHKQMFLYNPEGLDVSAFETLGITLLYPSTAEFNFSPSPDFDEDGDGRVAEDPIDGQRSENDDIRMDEDPTDSHVPNLELCDLRVNQYHTSHYLVQVGVVVMLRRNLAGLFGTFQPGYPAAGWIAIGVRWIRVHTQPTTFQGPPTPDDFDIDEDKPEPADAALIVCTVGNELGNTIYILDHDEQPENCVMYDDGNQLALANRNPQPSSYCTERQCRTKWRLK